MVAGAVAVYVTGGPSGNSPAPAPQVAQVDTTADKKCEAIAERGKAMASAATGEVAAMLPADPPRSLSSLAFTDPVSGKSYAMKDKVAVIIPRPRGWHLPEVHVQVDGEGMSGPLFGFGLPHFHNTQDAPPEGPGAPLAASQGTAG